MVVAVSWYILYVNVYLRVSQEGEGMVVAVSWYMYVNVYLRVSQEGEGMVVAVSWYMYVNVYLRVSQEGEGMVVAVAELVEGPAAPDRRLHPRLVQREQRRVHEVADVDVREVTQEVVVRNPERVKRIICKLSFCLFV